VQRRLRPKYPDWDDGSRSVVAPSSRAQRTDVNVDFEGNQWRQAVCIEGLVWERDGFVPYIVQVGRDKLFRVSIAQPSSSDRNKPVYEFGRNGKVNVAVAAAVMVAVVVTVGLFIFLSPKRSEAPAEPTRKLASDAAVLTKLSLSLDGASLAAASAKGEVIVWRLPERRSTTAGKATDSAATLLSWSPDGLLVCGDSSGLLRAWPQADLKESTVDSPRVAVTGCVFRQKLADKQMLLGLSDGRIVTITPSETMVRESGHRGVKAMLISDDQSTLVSAGSEGELIWYDFKRDENVATASVHETEIAALAWSPGGAQFVSADWNGELRIWDTKKRKLMAEAKQPDAVSALVWIDDRMVTGSWDGRIRVWNVESNQPELAFSIFTGRPIHDLVVESSGETAFTVSGDGSVREWSLTTAVAE
tara:strand:+ start:55722 stop:56975 length:1254 start_codon:yes stop_codon:yes gene_type:complete